MEVPELDSETERLPEEPNGSLVVIWEVDRMNRAVKRKCSKAQNMARNILQIKKHGHSLEQEVGKLLACLQDLDAELDPQWLTQWRQQQRILHPRAKSAKSEPPEDMTCRKCKRVFDDPMAFFMDDGYGEYGYTGRCIECRKNK